MDKFYKYIIEDLDDKLCEISTFINTIELQTQMLVEVKSIDLTQESTFPSLQALISNYKKLHNSRVYYNAIVISLYACFENFIDSIASVLIDFYEDNFVTFDKIPTSIQDKYIKNFGEYLSNPQRYNGIDKNPKEIISKVYKNISNDKNESLQKEFLLRHGGNMKIDKVEELFTNLSLKNLKSKILNNDIFKNYISEKESIEANRVSQYFANSKEAFILLDKLVDARNSVAHTWDADNRISNDYILNNVIPFLHYFCTAIYEVIISYIYESSFDKTFDFFDAPIQVINHTILCINSKKSKLHIGDYIGFKDSKNNFKIAKILSLKKDNISEEYIIDENINIGIGLDRRIKNTYNFYYFK